MGVMYRSNFAAVATRRARTNRRGDSIVTSWDGIRDGHASLSGSDTRWLRAMNGRMSVRDHVGCGLSAVRDDAVHRSPQICVHVRAI